MCSRGFFSVRLLWIHYTTFIQIFAPICRLDEFRASLQILGSWNRQISQKKCIVYNGHFRLHLCLKSYLCSMDMGSMNEFGHTTSAMLYCHMTYQHQLCCVTLQPIRNPLLWPYWVVKCASCTQLNISAVILNLSPTEYYEFCGSLFLPLKKIIITF